MKIIQPLFLDDLYEAYTSAKDNVKKLRQLLVRISKMKFFDPACGSGNFLIIAYKELRKLEILVWKRIAELSGNYELPFVNIQLTQFYGIEIDDFAQEVASLSLRLAEHQMNRKFTAEFANVSIPALPLGRSGNIVHGNACRIDWNVVCPHTPEEEVFVMGNPPYLGSRRQDAEQKKDMEVLFVKNFGELDYIACWFLSAANYIRGTKSKSAFVSTNSICQGLQVSLLWERILRGNLIISFAYKSFKWTNNAKHTAGVTVIVVGLAMSENVRNKIIYDGKQSRKVNNISPLLMDGATIFVKSETSPLCEDFPAMNFGNMPADGGKLIMSTEERDEFIGLYPGAEQFIRPLIGAEDFINGKQRWCIWLYDKNPKEYLAIPELRQRIEELKIIRKKSSRPQLASIPHLFAQITQPLGVSFIIIPAVSSEHRNYIPMGYLDENHIAANSCMVVGTDEMWLFGILTSLMHMAWVKTVGGRLETRYRYSAQLCYNTFPFPKISDAKKQEIEEAAEEVLLVREDYPGKTLAELYDPDKMPDDLREAHHRLDLIVESCYQDKPFANDEERLECLFRLYEKMTKKP